LNSHQYNYKVNKIKNIFIKINMSYSNNYKDSTGSSVNSNTNKPSILISAKKIESESRKKKVDDKINNLMKNLLKILNYERIHEVSYSHIYKLCYDISIEKGGNLLYEAYVGNLQEYINQLFTETLEYIKISESAFFRKICEGYTSFIKKVEIIQKTLLYFEKNFLLKNNLPNVKIISKSIYEKQILNEKVTQLLINFILHNLEKDRDSKFIDKLLLKDLIDLIIDLNEDFYEKIIISNILSNTSIYYNNDYLKNIQTRNSSEYCAYVKTRIQNEEQRISDLNLLRSKQLIMSNLVEKLVMNLLNEENRVTPYIINLVKLNDTKNLIVLKEISLFELQEKFIEILSRSLEQFGKDLIKEKCSYWNNVKNHNIVNNTEENLNIIQSILDFLDKLENIKRDLNILNNKNYLSIISQRIGNVINNKDYPLLIAKILPKHIDHMFKLYFKEKSNNLEHINYLDRVVTLIRFIVDKDIFEINHRRLLSFRLLNGIFYEDIETKFLGKLKLENGTVFTHRCEVMINDLKSSSHMMEQYSNSIYFHKKIKMGYENVSASNNSMTQNSFIDFNIKVLTQGNWIVNSEENFSTADLLSLIDRNKDFSFLNILSYFDNFYKAYYHNKILHHNLFIGSCDVFCKIKNRNYFISMQPIQAFICVLFHKNKESVSLSKISEIFNLNEMKLLINCILPLIKSGLILVNSEEEMMSILKNSQVVTNKENNFNNSALNIIFSANLNFFNKQQRLKISQARYTTEKISNSEEKQGESVYLERKYIIESNIIRIMKSKKSIQHQDLLNEVLSAVNHIFVPEISVIKQRIESLLERGYIARATDCYTTYVYTA
jgi:cullin 3